MAKGNLNIVDENDKVIGIEDRQEIHKKGLLHREVHVHFVTLKNEIIFQHRAKDKDTFPDLLDATVGGHVEIGDDYESSAIKEAFEETGVSLDVSDLIFMKKIHKSSNDKVTGKTNHAFQQEYLYVYKGRIEDLKIEEGKGLGFEAWEIEKLLNVTDEEKLRFITHAYNFTTTVLVDFIKNNLKNKI